MVCWLLENTVDNTACSQWKWYYLLPLKLHHVITSGLTPPLYHPDSRHYLVIGQHGICVLTTT
jgi:hypothetical protein